MIDIVIGGAGEDLQTFNTQTNRAANILGIQVGSLEYEQALGIDLNYFLSEEFSFENASFYSYLIQILAGYGINVATMTATIHDLFQELDISLSPEENSTGLMAR